MRKRCMHKRTQTKVSLLNGSVKPIAVNIAESVIAVCGTGHDWCASARQLWEYGMRKMEARLRPTLVFIYGAPTEIPGFTTPIKFIEDHITRKFRKAI